MMSSLHTSLKKVKNINRIDTYTVYGFIRECEALLNGNIPPIINHIILCYFYNGDRWNKEYIPHDIDGIIIDENILKLKSISSCSVYLTNIISNGIYKWKFKISSVTKLEPIELGIWKKKFKYETRGFFSERGSNRSYAFSVRYGRLINPENCNFYSSSCCNYCNRLYGSYLAPKFICFL